MIKNKVLYHNMFIHIIETKFKMYPQIAVLTILTLRVHHIEYIFNEFCLFIYNFKMMKMRQ